MLDLKQRRLELGLTMLEVAKIVGVSEATISRYESGNIKNMRRDRINKYAKALNVDASLLIDEFAWDKAAEEFKKQLSDDSKWLKKYLSERFSDEDVSTAYELIIQLPQFNKEGLIKILERMDELSEVKKYLAEIE